MFKGRMDDLIEVFVNPSQKELRRQATEGWIRFIADNKTKKLYIWGGLIELHDIVWRRMKIDSRKATNSSSLLSGSAKKKGTRFTMVDSSTLRLGKEEVISDIKNTDWSWIERYIDLGEYAKELKK
jgi:urate oxidase